VNCDGRNPTPGIAIEPDEDGHAGSPSGGDAKKIRDASNVVGAVMDW
jgi:hypothetical protein